MGFSEIISRIAIFYLFYFLTTFVKKDDLNAKSISEIMFFVIIIAFGMSNSESEPISIHYWVTFSCFIFMGIFSIWYVKTKKP